MAPSRIHELNYSASTQLLLNYPPAPAAKLALSSSPAEAAAARTHDSCMIMDGLQVDVGLGNHHVDDEPAPRRRERVVCAVLHSLRRLNAHILESDTPFWLLDVGRTHQLLAEWRAAFPRVRPFYAVKCNSHPLFLRTLSSLGAGFDCASKEELQQVTSLGVPPERIVFANPCKLQSHMECATAAGVHLTTFDSEAELHKIKKSTAPDKVRLLLRIATNDEGATIRLSSKYGARMEEVPALLQSAMEAGLAVVGVAFHIGSGASNRNAYEEAIAHARNVFDLGKQLLDKAMYVLNIGGGFCSSGPELEEGSTGGGLSARDVAPLINDALNVHFPHDKMPELEVIAEPGRYFACAPFTLVVRIFGKRVRGSTREYWINDGAHSSFTMILLPHNTAVPPPIPFACASQPHNVSCKGLPLYASNVFGPTCSALDTLLKGHPLPELELGDMLAFPFMGAYTNSLATSFNGFSVANIPAFGFVADQLLC